MRKQALGRTSFASNIVTTRPGRIAVVLAAWFVVRESASRTNGFHNGPILCPLRFLTGYPCPGCGGIRAMGEFCRGHFEKAWAFNPMVFAAVVIVLLWAFQIRSINKFVEEMATQFRRLTKPLQILLIICLYAVAWITAIARFNSGIL